MFENKQRLFLNSKKNSDETKIQSVCVYVHLEKQKL